MRILELFSILTVTQLSVVDGKKTFLDGYLGCYWDRGKRDLSTYLGNNPGTIHSCRKLAAKKKLKYFGLQVGGQCFGGNKYGSYKSVGADSYCANQNYRKKYKETSTERMQFWGSNWINAVYMTKEQTFSPKKNKDMTLKGFFIGCYHDDKDRSYDDRFKDKKNRKVSWTKVESVEECGNLAIKNKMPYFAMQYGEQCRMSKKMFPHYWKYPPVLGNSVCAKKKAKKTSKKWGNFGGAGWTNALYYTVSSQYYPAASWDTPLGDDTIRLAWANAYCLNVEGGKFEEGKNIMAYWCVDQNGRTAANMKWTVSGGLIKVKSKPSLCISFVGKKLVTSKTLQLAKCGKKDTFQKINMYDDMTIRFTGKNNLPFGFNVFGGIGGRDGINTRPIKTYKVTAANNEAFVIRSSAPPTPKPTPQPTPYPKKTGLKKAMGWSITKGTCTIAITSGVPCAVTPNYPKKYPDDDSCQVKMTKTKALKPEVFITERFFDQVKIGGVKMSGQLVKKPYIDLKKGVDTIDWSSDFYLAGKGWKICKTTPRKPPMPGKRRKKELKCNEKLNKKGKKKGTGYRGCQTKTRSGKTCMKWTSQSPHKHSYTPGKYPKAGLVKNYCRNPWKGGSTIWCYTTDKKKRWEYCNPGGIVKGKKKR